MKKIMILGASILQLPAIKKAKEMGFEVIAVDMNSDSIGFKEPGIIKEVISTIDIPAVKDAAKKHKIDGIMTLASDMPMRTVAAVAKEMNLIGIDEETAIKATNKAEMRKALKKGKVPIPIFYKVSNLDEYLDAVKFIRDNGYKVIIKPADNSGSRGVNLINDYSKKSLVCAYKYTKEYSRSGDVVVEEYMEGPEVSVETLTVGGVCHVIQITDKITTGAPYFVEMGHSQPSQHSEKIKSQITEVAIAANNAIGIKNGPAHIEIKITKDGPKIVEIGARLGGDNITTHLVPLSTGVDMVEACIKIALGENPNIKRTLEKGSAIRYFDSRKGLILRIDGIENAYKVDDVKQVSIVHNPGEIIDDIKSSSERVGFVITQANTAVEAILSAEEAKKRIQVVEE